MTLQEKPVTEAQEMFGARAESANSEEKSRKANQEFFQKHDTEDERNTEYASQREETRALRKHRQHESRARVKDSFIQSDGDFHNKDGFVEAAGAEIAGNKKLEKLQDNCKAWCGHRKDRKHGSCHR